MMTSLPLLWDRLYGWILYRHTDNADSCHWWVGEVDGQRASYFCSDYVWPLKKVMTVLSEHVIQGDFERVRQLASRELMMMHGDQGRNVLMLAAESKNSSPGTAKCIHYLVHLGCCTYSIDAKGNTAAHLAAQNDNLRFLTALTHVTAVPFDWKWQQNDQGRTPLMEAARLGNWKCAKHLLHLFRQQRYYKMKGFVANNDRNGLTAFDIAKENGNEEIGNLIEIEWQATVSWARNCPLTKTVCISNELGEVRNQLMRFFQSNNVSALQQKLTIGNCDLPDIHGRTILWQCVQDNQSNESLLRLLMSKADPTCADVAGSSCLHAAVRKGNEEVIKALIDAGVNVNERTEDGVTALMRVATSSELSDSESVTIADLLLDAGADWTIESNSSSTALKFAVEHGKNSLVKLLSQYEGRSYFEVAGASQARHSLTSIVTASAPAKALEYSMVQLQKTQPPKRHLEGSMKEDILRKSESSEATSLKYETEKIKKRIHPQGPSHRPKAILEENTDFSGLRQLEESGNERQLLPSHSAVHTEELDEESRDIGAPTSADTEGSDREFCDIGAPTSAHTEEADKDSLTNRPVSSINPKKKQEQCFITTPLIRAASSIHPERVEGESNFALTLQQIRSEREKRASRIDESDLESEQETSTPKRQQSISAEEIERLFDAEEPDKVLNEKWSRGTNETPLMLLAKSDADPELAVKLLKAGASIRAKNSLGQTPICMASTQGNNKLLKIFTNKSHIKHLNVVEEVNKPDNSLSTPLMHAAANNHPDTVKLLHSMGADVKKVDRCKLTALAHAAKRGSQNCVAILIDIGAEANTKDFCDNTPLIWAARGNYLEVIKELSRVPELEWTHRGEYKMTALEWAKFNKFQDCCDLIQQSMPKSYQSDARTLATSARGSTAEAGDENGLRGAKLLRRLLLPSFLHRYRQQHRQCRCLPIDTPWTDPQEALQL
ncbi:hypothetical protein BOX15_Mlig003046g1 [Macrostomum lignano]|uniref:Uncharacterized protein n=1 Tax=Macrostomum lignano TaxID=282301 RepID=A0A267H0P9_9PLAT|nr:hypothetical protein BOX15_Mlig003046g1 [Macrostomum lignano]